jgi:hypothetical protein
VNTFIKRAAVDPNAAMRRSDPNALSILARIDIAAAWVHAIRMASAPSISSLGAAASTIARAALIAVSENGPLELEQ